MVQQHLVKAEGDNRWYPATPDGDALKVDFGQKHKTNGELMNRKAFNEKASVLGKI